MNDIEPWGLHGPKFATGRHVKGHKGAIFRSPFGNQGGIVAIAHKRKRKPYPWTCGCDRLEGTFFSATHDTGPGWVWSLVEPSPDEHRLKLYCTLDVETEWSIAGHLEDKLRLQQAIEALSRVQIEQYRIEGIYCVHETPPRFGDGSKEYARYRVILSVSGPVVEDFRPYTILEDGPEAILITGAILQ